MSKSRLFLTLSLCALAVSAVLLGAWSTFMSSVKGELLVGTVPIRYEFGRDDDVYTAFTSYDFATPEQARIVIAAMNQKAAALVGEGRTVRATLAFTEPMTADALRAFAREYQLLVYSSIARAWMGEGQLGEIQLPAEFETNPNGGGAWLFHPKPGGDPIDPASLASAVDNRDLVGFVLMKVDLDQATFARVVLDPRIVAVDVLEQLMIDEVHQYFPFAPADRIFVTQSMMYDVGQKARLTSAPTSP